MARKKKQAQSTSRPAPAATVSATAAAPAGDDGPRPAQSLAGTSRSAADGDATSVASRVAAECAAILRDIDRGARQVSLVLSYLQSGGRCPRSLRRKRLRDTCPPHGPVRHRAHIMRATPHACMVQCSIRATDAPSPFRDTTGGPSPPGLTHAATLLRAGQRARRRCRSSRRTTRPPRCLFDTWCASWSLVRPKTKVAQSTCQERGRQQSSVSQQEFGGAQQLALSDAWRGRQSNALELPPASYGQRRSRKARAVSRLARVHDKLSCQLVQGSLYLVTINTTLAIRRLPRYPDMGGGNPQLVPPVRAGAALRLTRIQWNSRQLPQRS